MLTIPSNRITSAATPPPANRPVAAPPAPSPDVVTLGSGKEPGFFKQVAQRALDAVTPPPPPYEQLTVQEQAQVDAAKVAGQGKSVPEQTITDKHGHHEEPINIEFTGTRQQLQGALEQEGWQGGYMDGQLPNLHSALEAPGNLVPFSPQFALNAKGQDVKPAFMMAKDTSGLNRHHLRAFLLGDDPSGQQVWGIAASRDNRMTTGLGHVIDKNVDAEQNTVLHDLFQACDHDGGHLALSVAHGQPDTGPVQQLGTTGSYNVNHGEYNSALDVYQVRFS